jgi:hypothetical protein
MCPYVQEQAILLTGRAHARLPRTCGPELCGIPYPGERPGRLRRSEAEITDRWRGVPHAAEYLEATLALDVALNDTFSCERLVGFKRWRRRW